MKRLGRITPFDAMRIARQCAGSLAAAHARGIVHRDLKPENIFLVKDQEAQGGERPKVLDFGIAKLSTNESNTKTRTGVMMGTPIYMSPEQCRGAGSVDHRSDIYSLGCVLFHMLTGRPPFDSEGMGELIAMHLREPAAPPSSLVPGIAVVDELVLKCLAKQPDDRFASMTDLQRAADGVMMRITNSGANASAATVAIATPVPPGFRSEYPQATAAPVSQPTTLSSAAGAGGTVPPAAPRKWGLFAGIGAVVVGGIVAAVIFAGGNKAKPESAAAPPPAAAPADAASVATTPVETPTVTAATPDAGVAPTETPAVVAAPADAGTTTAASTATTTASTTTTTTTAPAKPTRPKKPKPTGKGSAATGGNLYDNR